MLKKKLFIFFLLLISTTQIHSAQNSFPPFKKVDFESIAQRERDIYENQIVPRIAERFAGAGALSSSGFRQALASAGGDLQTRLAALKVQHDLQQQQLELEYNRRQLLYLSHLSQPNNYISNTTFHKPYPLFMRILVVAGLGYAAYKLILFVYKKMQTDIKNNENEQC